MTGMARVNVYESDPMLTWAKAADVEGWDDYYEVPAVLLADFVRAEAELDRARDALLGHIREHRVVKVCPWDEADR